MAERPLWFVRAGEDAAYVDDFRKLGFVGLGWPEIGPLPDDFTDEDLDERLATAFPEKKENSRRSWAGFIRRFMRELRPGDSVVTYDPRERIYVLGTIDSDVEWHDDHPNPRWRRVTWTDTVAHDSLTESTRRKLGSIGTLFKVGEQAEAELMQSRGGQLQAGESSANGSSQGLGFVAEDFDVLRRNPKSVPWLSLPKEDQDAIRRLRNTLKECAKQVADKAKSALPMKPFVSITSPSGRNARHYWSCAYPASATNKSFAFQLFMIVTPDGLELGFGPGSGSGEMEADTLEELSREFNTPRLTLFEHRTEPWIKGLGTEAKRDGFEFRKRWLKEGPSEIFNDIVDWLSFATHKDGGGAAISRFISRADVLGMGTNAGNWICARLMQFMPLMNLAYTGQAPLDVWSEEQPITTTTQSVQKPALSMAWLEEQTLWSRSQLEEVLDTLNGASPQAILAGPPGTSKTWIAEQLARFITQDRPNQRRLVQFHPSYSYEEFIEGLRPVSKSGAISFEVRPGTVLQMAAGLKPTTPKRVLIIDEMNRANVPRVFGELLYLLEYRERPIELQYSSGFELPAGLVFIGTMNTADRSIRSIDVALRRRFDLFECPPRADILEKYYSERSNEVESLVSGFEKLNVLLTEHLDRHHTIGHAFLMSETMTAQRLARIWKLKVEPLIEEYFFDQPDLLTEFRVGQFWPEAADAS